MEEENNPVKTDEEVKNENVVNEAGKEDVKEKIEKVLDTEDTTSDYTKEDMEKNKVMAILSYLGILALIPYFGAKESKFAQYHAKQGLNFAILAIGATVGFNIISAILRLIKVSKTVYYWGIPYTEKYTPGVITVPLNIISWVLSIAISVIAIIGIVNVCQNKAKELPLVGKIKIIK